MKSPATIIVTGASSGLGYAISEMLAKRGHNIFAAMRGLSGKNSEAARSLSAVVSGAGGQCVPIEIDVTNDDSVTSGVAHVVRDSGRIDVVVNCAGIMWLGVSEAFSIEQFDRVMQTNLYGPFRMMKAALPHMRAQKSGLFIAVSSISGRLTTAGSGLYSASKWGLEALAETLRYETSQMGIDSVIVQPGPFRTNLKANASLPSNMAVAEAYGELRALEKTIPPRMAAYMAQHPGPSTDPVAVAECVSELIAMPTGTRPLRTTVGYDLGVKAINQLVEGYQNSYMGMLGLETLLQTQAPSSDKD